MNLMIKAKAYPPGTVRTWNGKKMVKRGDGKWVPAPSGKKPSVDKGSETWAKSLASETDVEHSLDMLRAAYRRRPPGQGFELPIASVGDLQKILRGTTYGLIGAGGRPEENLSKKNIQKRLQQMKDDFTENGFVVTQAIGKYGELEDSFFVMCHDADRNEMIKFGMRYQQESVIFANKGKQEMIYTYGDKVGQTMAEGEGFEWMPSDAEDYYTEVQAGSKKVRFSLLFSVWKSLKLVLGFGK